jgi:protein arginine kinase
VGNCDRSLIDMMLLEIQPAHLQLNAARELSPEERDSMRAEITRARLQSIDGPGSFPPSQSTPGGPPSAPNDE